MASTAAQDGGSLDGKQRVMGNAVTSQDKAAPVNPCCSRERLQVQRRVHYITSAPPLGGFQKR